MRHLAAIILLATLTACGDLADNDPSADTGIDSGEDVGGEVQDDPVEGIGACGYCSGTVDDPVWTACRNPVPTSGEGGPDSDGACWCYAVAGEEFPGGNRSIDCVPDVSYCPCLLSGATCEWPTSTYALDGFPLCSCQGDSCTQSL